MKIFNLILILFFADLSHSETITLSPTKIDSLNLFTLNSACLEVKIINGEKYCLRKSSITLNSCGPSSDWPCLEDKGCLKINQFIKD